MFNKSKLEIVGTIIAALALIGPFAYLCLALFELGRLHYFNAPTDFISLGNFGIYPLLSKVIPVVMPMLMIMGVFVSAYTARGKVRVIRICAALGMMFSLLSVYSATSFWKWGFGIAMVLCILPGLLLDQNIPDVGNTVPEEKPIPEHVSIVSANRLRRSVIWLIPIALFSWVLHAAGMRDAESQKDFWMAEKGVIVGFYGETALLMEMDGQAITANFEIIKLEDAGKLVLKPLGPDIGKKIKQM